MLRYTWGLYVGGWADVLGVDPAGVEIVKDVEALPQQGEGRFVHRAISILESFVVDKIGTQLWR